LLAACLLAFGILLPWLGFYQDDWYQIWFRRAFGPQVFIDYYSYERPFIAGIYMLTTSLLGNLPTAWQVFGLLSRWLAACSVWWALGLVWPKQTRLVTWAALLVAVYPAFRQQFAAVIYSHYFLQLAIQMASIGLSILAIRQPRRAAWLTIAALLTAAIALFTSEYFFGVELLRPLLMFFSLGNDPAIPKSSRWRIVLRRWLPYLALALAFLAWRVFIFQFPTYKPILASEANASRVMLSLQLAQAIGRGMVEAGALGWGLALEQLATLGLGQKISLAAIGLGLAAGIAAFIYLQRLGKSSPDAPEPGATSERQAALQMLVTGGVGLLLAGAPFWLVGIPVDTRFDAGSRFTISFMLAASLLMAGLVGGLLRNQNWQNLVIAALVGLAATSHLIDANRYRQVHQRQATFFQQLAWRAPGLSPGTLVLTNAFYPLTLSGDLSMSAALNWVYDQQPPFALDYLLFDFPERLKSGDIPALEPSLPIQRGFRTAQFNGSTSQMLAVYDAYPACLRVLDPALDSALPKPKGMSKEIKAAAGLSNLDLIEPSAEPPAVLPPGVFKFHPTENSWCYLYEKADLARQVGDWQAIVQLGDEAEQRKYTPNNSWELLPFIEGYARMDQLEDARRWTEQARLLAKDEETQIGQALCITWQRLGQDAPENQPLAQTAQQVQTELGCQSR
jgi:hypothetical protein